MIEVIEIKESEERKKRAQFWWDRHKNDFVVITKKNDAETTGILKELTELDYLKVQLHGQSWYIDPLDIKHVYAKPDKYQNGGGFNRQH